MKASLRAFVRMRAGRRCEYCRLHEDDLPLYPFHLEHILPRKHGGSDDRAGLDMWRTVPLFLLLLPSGRALAYKPVSPERHDVFSSNGAFVLDVDPQAKRLTVYATGKRDQPLWSFNRSVWQEKHFLSDDGKVVALVTWRFVQVGELQDGVCVEFWDRTGKIREYTFAELCPNPARYFFESGPVGSFWRKWYSEAEGTGSDIRVRTTGEFEYIFAMDDGRIIGTHRVGLSPWHWWAMWIIVGSGGILLLFLRLRRRRNKIAESPAPV